MGNVSSLAVAREARRPQQSPHHGGKGFALLHRKIMDTPFYKDPEASHLFVHLVLRANHEQTIVPTELGDVMCVRGQFVSGRDKLAFETGLKSDRVQYLLRKLEKLGAISTKSNRKFTLITVTKYDEYQQFSLPTDYQQITNGKAGVERLSVEVVPTDYQQITNGKAGVERLSVEVVPTDYQQITTDKELNNNSLGKPNESASASEKSAKPKQTISCQDVIDAYHEILPEAKSVRALTEKRRSSIKTFWRKAGVVTRQLDGHGFTMDDWRQYLGYVRDNCRWMFEERQNQQRGTVWHKKGFDFLLNDNVYLKVREGDHDDR